MLALDPDTGKLKWYFSSRRTICTTTMPRRFRSFSMADWEGHPRKLLIQANRNGFFYVLDRTDGKFLFARPFGNVTWAKGIAPDGKPIVNTDLKPNPVGTRVCPGH